MKKLCSLAIMGCALFVMINNVTAQNLPAYLPSNGLVAWYPFNGNANDESGNGNDLVANSPFQNSDRNGIYGNAFGFQNDNSNSLICNINSSLNTISNANQFTISEWFNVQGFPSGVFSFASFYNIDNDLGWELIYHNGTGGFFFIADSYSSSPVSLPIVFNEWHNLTYKCDLAEGTSYLLKFQSLHLVILL